MNVSKYPQHFSAHFCKDWSFSEADTRKNRCAPHCYLSKSLSASVLLTHTQLCGRDPAEFSGAHPQSECSACDSFWAGNIEAFSEDLLLKTKVCQTLNLEVL